MKTAVNAWLKIAAWLAIIAIVIVTVVPIGMRPSTSLSPNRERFIALAIVGGLFVLAYPNRIWAVIVALSGAVALLEPLQYFALGRHASVHDVMIKSAGAAVGAFMGHILIRALGLRAKK